MMHGRQLSVWTGEVVLRAPPPHYCSSAGGGTADEFTRFADMHHVRLGPSSQVGEVGSRRRGTGGVVGGWGGWN